MPNVLYQPYVEGVQQEATAPLYDPRFEQSSRRRFHRPAIPQLDLANALYVSSGLCPARGWILLRRQDYDNLNLYATNLQLQIADPRGPTSLTLQNLSIVQARCVSRGVAADPGAIYLVELTDARGLVWNRWFSWPTASFFNVRAPAYPQEFYTDSLLFGTTPYTWNLMLQTLWQSMTPLGDYPGLPATVDVSSTPEGFTFSGVSAWEAVCRILELLGCIVAVDLTSATPYSIVDLTQADDAFLGQQVQYISRLEDDEEYIDAGAGRAPASVIVYFQRRNEYYGTEETVRMDSLQWSSTPLFAVSVAAPAEFSKAVGVHHLWSEFTVRFDVDNNPLAADVTTANTIAAARAAQYYAWLSAGTSGHLKQTYAGPLPFKTGSRVDGVCWRMDFPVAEHDRGAEHFSGITTGEQRGLLQPGRLGWRTLINFGARPAWKEVLPDAR